METLLAALSCTVAAGSGGLLVPAMIARIPEPEPDDVPEESTDSAHATEASEAAEADEPKEAYAAIAALPGLAWKSALAAAGAGAVIGGTQGWDWSLLLLVSLVPVSVALAVVDWRTRLLPTYLIKPAYGVAVVLVLVCFALTRDPGGPLGAVVGWAIAGGTFGVLWFVHPRGLGYGDVRLAGVLGIALGYLGIGPLLIGVYAGFLLGGVGGGLLSVLRIVERRAFPFGPFMLVGALAGIAFGQDLWSRLVVGG